MKKLSCTSSAASCRPFTMLTFFLRLHASRLDHSHGWPKHPSRLQVRSSSPEASLPLSWTSTLRCCFSCCFVLSFPLSLWSVGRGFQVRGCRMVRYKDSDHAFLVGVLFVLMFLWLSAFVCICFVCLSPFASDGPSVCVHQCLAEWACGVSLCVSALCLSVCLSRTSCVSCLLCLLSVPWRLLLLCVGLGCLDLSYLGLSCLVLSACHQSLLYICCVYSSSRSASFVCPSLIPFVRSLHCSCIGTQGVSCSSFFSRERK